MTANAALYFLIFVQFFVYFLVYFFKKMFVEETKNLFTRYDYVV